MQIPLYHLIIIYIFVICLLFVYNIFNVSFFSFYIWFILQRYQLNSLWVSTSTKNLFLIVSHSSCRCILRCAAVHHCHFAFQNSLIGTRQNYMQASSLTNMPLQCVQHVVLHCLYEKCMDALGLDVILKASQNMNVLLCINAAVIRCKWT